MALIPHFLFGSASVWIKMYWRQRRLRRNKLRLEPLPASMHAARCWTKASYRSFNGVIRPSPPSVFAPPTVRKRPLKSTRPQVGVSSSNTKWIKSQNSVLLLISTPSPAGHARAATECFWQHPPGNAATAQTLRRRTKPGTPGAVAHLAAWTTELAEEVQSDSTTHQERCEDPLPAIDAGAAAVP